MPLVDEMQRTGAQLFRWRSYIPLVLVFVLGAALTHFSFPWGSHALDIAWDALCLCISLFGLGIRVVTVGHVSNRTSGRNTKSQIADELNTTGMYSIVRHPLYFGNFWIWFGIALFPRVWWCACIIALATLIFYERVMLAEERFLRERFGQTFETWANRTPAFWPRLRSWTPPSRPFSFRMALRREYSGLLAIASAFTVLETLSHYIVEGSLHIEPFWAAFFGLSLAAYVTLRTLKKKGLLDEPRGMHPEPATRTKA